MLPPCERSCTVSNYVEKHAQNVPIDSEDLVKFWGQSGLTPKRYDPGEFTMKKHLLGISALKVIFYNEMRYINLRFTYLITYLLTYSTGQNESDQPKT